MDAAVARTAAASGCADWPPRREGGGTGRNTPTNSVESRKIRRKDALTNLSPPMPNQQRISTPRGTLEVLSNQLPGGSSYVATVVYFDRHPGNPDDPSDLGSMHFKHHTELAATEQVALSAILTWCQATFGNPCTFV